MGGVTIMAISTVFVKICGALYKIPLNNILGDEGVAHFMSAYNIYALLLTVSTAGLPLALSKLISEANATNRRTQMRRCFHTAMVIFVVLGAIGSAVMLLFTRQLAAAMKNPLAYWPIKCLGVSVICVSIMCAYRGFAQGRQNMVPTAVSQFIEAFTKLAVGLPLAWYLIHSGQPLEIGAAGAIVGVSAGIVLAMLYMWRNYRKNRGPILWGTDVPQSYVVIARRLLALGIPITIFESDIFDVTVQVDKNPCYLCARMRRGCLYARAQELGCNKIALGHHYDDVIETILMGMFYGAQIETMMPKLHSMNFEGMELIRPMYLIREADIQAWRDYHGLEFLQGACRFTENCASGRKHSKRDEMKELIGQLRDRSSFIEQNIFNSVKNVNLNKVIGYKKDGEIYHFLDRY